MTTETHEIATRLAAASEVFPLKKTDNWASIVLATAQDNVINVVVTDRLGRGIREYRAVIKLVAETATANG